jgi:hypothetical protein
VGKTYQKGMSRWSCNVKYDANCKASRLRQAATDNLEQSEAVKNNHQQRQTATSSQQPPVNKCLPTAVGEGSDKDRLW